MGWFHREINEDLASAQREVLVLRSELDNSNEEKELLRVRYKASSPSSSTLLHREIFPTTMQLDSNTFSGFAATSTARFPKEQGNCRKGSSDL